MTDFRIEQLPFDRNGVDIWAMTDAKFRNWPVVYTLDGGDRVYVGESLNAAGRLRQHLDNVERQSLTSARVVIDDSFNKSACLDLESFLIRMFAGDGKFIVQNRNDGITDADYFDRRRYQQVFDRVFDELRSLGLFSRPIRDIENSDLFKLSPFKALTNEQASAVEDILSGLFDDLQHKASSRIVIRGEPGTGKTIVGIFLMKLLKDIQYANTSEPPESDSILSEFFVEGYPQLLQDFRIGLVVPQQSLRRSIQNVFAKTPGLDRSMVMTPFDVGRNDASYDLLIVDETHRLNQRANQASGVRNRDFADITQQLFGWDDPSKTQLDWIEARSNHQIYLLDSAQRVRPADLPAERLEALLNSSGDQHRAYALASQMRVRAGDNYVGYVRSLLSNDPPRPRAFSPYELVMFDDLEAMRWRLREDEERNGLARLVAGYAWPWRTKSDRTAYDIEIAGQRLRWNSSQVDWINSPKSVDEVGSIHTVQGYDLNFVGVIIGQDLRWDPERGRMWFDRSHYFDKKGMENNPKLGLTYSDDDLLAFVRNIYAVLLTRGIRGTYVYICDPALRDHLRPYFEAVLPDTKAGGA